MGSASSLDHVLVLLTGFLGLAKGARVMWLRCQSSAWPLALVSFRWPAALFSVVDHVEGQLPLTLV